MISVTTYRGAMFALPNQNSTNRDLFKTQFFGLTRQKVFNAKHNGTICAFTNKMRSDISSFEWEQVSSEQPVLGAGFSHESAKTLAFQTKLRLSFPAWSAGNGSTQSILSLPPSASPALTCVH